MKILKRNMFSMKIIESKVSANTRKLNRECKTCQEKWQNNSNCKGFNLYDWKSKEIYVAFLTLITLFSSLLNCKSSEFELSYAVLASLKWISPKIIFEFNSFDKRKVCENVKNGLFKLINRGSLGGFSVASIWLFL